MVAAPGVSIDAVHGGRWTSLRLAGREWLWQRPAPERAAVSPGDKFVDAGGLEECLPTVRGVPDHGDVWSRPWEVTADGTHRVRNDDIVLVRTIMTSGDEIRADYRLEAEPGYRFVWAGHALLDLAVGARVEVPGARIARVDEGDGVVEVAWPECAGLRMDEFGPDDGSAVGAIVLDSASVLVHDDADRLRFVLDAPGLPTSIALWRNLGGFPAGAPYRSIGVEPMLGQVWDLADAHGPHDAVTVPPTGQVTWTLRITAG